MYDHLRARAGVTQALTGAVTQDMGPEVRYRCMAASEKAVLELD